MRCDVHYVLHVICGVWYVMRCDASCKMLECVEEGAHHFMGRDTSLALHRHLPTLA